MNEAPGLPKQVKNCYAENAPGDPSAYILTCVLDTAGKPLERVIPSRLIVSYEKITDGRTFGLSVRFVKEYVDAGR